MTAFALRPIPRGSSLSLRRRAVRPALLALLTVASYHESLRTLLDWLTLDTPIAHLALVPLLAALLAVLRRRPARVDEIHDRQLDWIVGLSLVLGALVINRLLPPHDSASYWEWRFDLLSMPVFVAGVVSLLYGVRTLWYQRLAVAFLFLAWPWPYYQFIDRGMAKLTDITAHVVALLADHLPGITTLSADAGRFEVRHRGDAFTVVVASSCSGANSLVGYALVGSALALVSGGSTRAKSLWLLTGLAVVWCSNILRILAIFVVGSRWGESVAIEGLHPYAGFAVFVIAIGMLLALAGRFQVDLFRRGLPAQPLPTEPARYSPRLPAALLVLVLLTVQIAGSNASLRSSDLVSFTLGPTRDVTFADSVPAPVGWSAREVETVDWASQYFGDGSRWVRYGYLDDDPLPAVGELHAPGSVIYADVISTTNRRALSAYGVEACYRFHDYEAQGRRSVDLGYGVTGVVLSWTETASGITWTSLYWHWPIRTSTGTHYERVTLIMSETDEALEAAPLEPNGVARSLQLAASDQMRRDDARPGDPAHENVHRFLTAFAQQLVATASHQ